MKTKIRQRLIAMALAGMMIAAPVGGSVYAADETIAVQAQPVAAAEVKEEAKEEVKADTKEIKGEIPEEKKEETAPEKAAEAVSVPEAKAAEEIKTESAAPAAEAQTEEKAEAAPEEQAVAEEDDLSDVVCGDEVSSQLTVHVTNILWNRYVNDKAVPYESTLKLVSGQTKSATAYTNVAGGTRTTVKVSTEDGSYTFLKVCTLASRNSGIKTASDAGSVRAINKINFNKGVATVTFTDGSTKKYINASDIYVSPVYSVEYNKTLSMKYIDNISTAGGSWSGTLDSYTHTFKNPDKQDHYSFINWENKSTGETYDPGEKFSISKADCTERNTEISFHTVWQPSVTVRYHYNGNTAEAESFDSVNVYDKSAEIDGVEYNAWYDEAGNILADGAAFEAPAPVTEKADRTIYNVYARRPVTITAASAEWTFDGQAHSDDSVSVTAGGLFEGDEIAAEISGSITAAGEAVNAIESVKIMRDGADVSEYYDITTEDGLLSVKAAPAPAAKTDNGTPADPENRQARPAARRADNQAAAEIAEQEAPAAEIAEQETPMAAAPEAFIADSEAPLAANSTWALLNLIMTIVTGIISAVLLAGYFGKKEDEDEDDGNEDAETKRKGLVRLASLIPAIGSVIAFILTENMNLQMALTDRWTILMAVILLIQAVTAILAKKQKEENEETAETAETI